MDVSAESLYEAIAQALAAVRGGEWVGDIGNAVTKITVMVKQPEISHVVKMQDFQRWLTTQGTTPAEMSF